ncbi:MAG: biotin/lipoyl-binding protein [Chitinophagaceae bacterium]|nr:biotin/lipoyl-binding protein [Chitinophagaceae bacterium]
MKRLFQYSIIVLTAVVIASCGDGRKQKLGSLGEKKAKLEELKKQQIAAATEIKTLEEEIEKLDTSAASQEKSKLISVTAVGTEDFSHYIDLQGKIDADDISYIAPPNGQGGIVTALYVKEGDYVKKGQLLLKMDDKVLRQQIQISQTQLVLAKDVYQRTKICGIKISVLSFSYCRRRIM